MPLKKPSDFFKKEETSLDSIKGEMDVSSPDKIERVSEAFTAFRSNLNHIQSLTDFSDTFDGFKDNVDKVDKLAEEIINVKQDIQNLIKKEELDDAMMAHLYFVEESITKIEKKATTINKEAVSNISKEVYNLSNLVNNFLKVDAPQYKKLVTESETRVDQRFSNFKENVNSKVEDLNKEVSFNIASVAQSIEGINEDQLSSIKDEVQFVDSRIDSILQNDLPEYKKFFAETEIRTDKKIKEAKTVFDEKITYVNETYKERIDELNSTVKEFVDKEVPKYSSLLLESKIKSEEDVKTLEKQVIERIQSLTNKIKLLSKDVDQKSDDIDTLVDQKISDLHKVISESKEEVSTISNTYDSLYKDFKKREIHESEKLESFENSIDRFSIKINKLESSLTDDICELQENLDTGTSKYYEDFKVEVDEFEKNLSEKLKDLKVDFTVNEKHIDGLRNEFQDVVDRLRLDEIEEKNKELTDKITHIEEVFEKFNEKTVLTEDIPYTQAYAENAKGYIDNPTIPGKPSNNTTDPLTQLDQNFVTLDQLQSHYRIFINRIQTQLATIGGGGAGFIKDLDDVDFDQSVGTNKLLIYDGTQWVGIASTALSGSSDSTLDDILGNGSETTKGMSVGVITATSGYFSGILTAASLNYDVVTDIYSTGIVTATKGIQITTLGLNIASGIATLTDGLRVGSAATISANGNATFSGIVTAASFVGDGTGLTGVASTDNIQTGTPARFLSNIYNSGISTFVGLSSFQGGVNIKAGSANTSLTVEGVSRFTGVTTFTGNVNIKEKNLILGDSSGVTNDRIVLGNGSDFHIYHPGTDSMIDNNTGNLILRCNVNSDVGGNIKLQPKAGEEGIVVIHDGAVELYHDNTKVIETDKHGAIITGVATATGFSGPLTGNVTGNTSGSSGSCSGNAATATALATARAIGGVNFDGTGDITLPGVNASGNQNTSGTSAGLTGSPSVELTNVVGAAASIAGIVTATTFKGALTGNVTGNTSGSSGSCSGNAATATALATARAIGGVNFDGTEDITLPGVNASGNQNTSGTSAGLTGSPSVELTNVVGAAASIAGIVTATTFIGALTGNVTGNASGSSGSCTGNAATATILETTRAIGGVNFNGSAAINLPGVNQSGNQNTSGTSAGLTGSPSVELTNIVGAAASVVGIVTATTFSGALTGNVTGNADTATTATTATNITVSANNSSDETVYPIFVDGATGGQGAESDTGLTYNPSDGELTATTFTGALTGNVTGNTSGSSGSCTGNAATATALASARNIGGVSFDGTGNIDLPGVNSAGNQNTTGTAAGITEADTAVSSTSATTVLSFAHASYRGAFVSLSITQGSNYQIGKYSIIHDGTTVTVVEESAVATGSMLGTFSGTISSSNLLLQVTMGSSSSATITVKADKITV